MRRFFRASLARRLFGWFGVTILTTGIMVGLAMAALSFFLPSGWQQEYRHWMAFVEVRFEHVWDRPDDLEQLVEHVATNFKIQVRVEDRQGALRIIRGEPCSNHAWSLTLPIERQCKQLGNVMMCADRHNVGARLVRMVVALVTLFGVLWLIALFVARRLTRPLKELAGVAEALGDGQLNARAEEALIYGGEVRTLAESLHDMAARIERQLHDQRALLAGVSHEMRTPLGHLRLLIEILRADGADSARLDELEREVVEMDDLVDRLLATSRLDFEMQHTLSVDATTIALEALERAGVDPSRLEVRNGGGAIRGDFALIRRGLANLITNATRHGGGVERLLVEQPEAGWIGLYVEDAGPGLPDAQLQRLFEPFVTYSSPELSGSLGLGLYLVRKIALAHGGKVEAGKGPDGRGARIGLVLPIFQELTEASTRPSEPSSSEETQ